MQQRPFDPAEITDAIEEMIRISREKIATSRIQLQRDEPFWATLSLRLTLQPCGFCPWFATDGKALYFNPMNVSVMPKDEVMGSIVHETDHNSSGHIWRRGLRDPELWNIATDYVVNLRVKWMGYKLPAGTLYDERFLNMAPEEVYAILLREQKQKPKKKGDGDPGGGDGHGHPDGESCKGLVEQPSKGENEQVKHTWEQAVVAAAKYAEEMHAKGQGKGAPAHIMARVAEIQSPVPHNLVAELLKFADSLKAGDFSWARPNIRYLPMGILLPGIADEPKMGELVIGWDTSGSITDRNMSIIGKKLHHVIDQIRPSKVWVIYCDAVVRSVDVFDEDDEIKKFNPSGRQGTRFEPVFEWVKNQDINPAAMVYFTDLEGSFPSEHPAYPVMWAIVPKGSQADAPFGVTIHLGEDI